VEIADGGSGGDRQDELENKYEANDESTQRIDLKKFFFNSNRGANKKPSPLDKITACNGGPCNRNATLLANFFYIAQVLLKYIFFINS
jgi:hypothetical protein